MGSSTKKKEAAQKLRRKGKSYTEIMGELDISSKGTLSYWFKDLKLNKEEKKRLQANMQAAQKRGLLKANKRKKERVQKENEQAFQKGLDVVDSLTRRELLLVGISLYWAEGTKSDQGTSSCLELANSDPDMISVYMRFLREIIGVTEERIRAGIHLHRNISEQVARKFWSEITALPEDRFFVTHALSKASKSKRPVNRLPHGTLRIRVNKRVLFHSMRGMIESLVDAARLSE